MSVRARLVIFLVLIVVIPMLAVGAVLLRVASNSETGKADARVSEARAAAEGLYEESLERARGMVLRVGADARLVAALRAGDPGAVPAQAQRLLAAIQARQVVVRPASGGPPVAVGAADAIAAQRGEVVDRSGRRLADLSVSAERAGDYARLVKRVADVDAVVARGGRTLATTIPALAGRTLPDRGRVKVPGDEYRVESFRSAGGRADEIVRVTVLADGSEVSAAIRDSRRLIGAAMLGFLALALLFALAVSRALRGQVGRLLDAARRVGAGDFTTEVPTDGHDEFAQLGEEFNRMSHQLEARVRDLHLERERLERAIRRVGDTFASNLDRDALLEIVVRTAVDGVGATGGRVLTRPQPLGELTQRTHAGRLEGLEPALADAERAALVSGSPAEAGVGSGHALACPLRESEDGVAVLGVVSAARADAPFSPRERELFNYLAGQAAQSIENVGLHEKAQRLAITDGLTGLANHRRFHELMATEVERARRFEQPLGLVLLDIDDFKRVNDTYGHQQGDLVLREVARALRESAREIDEPARYGGEELAVVLPQTDLEGAHRLAERVREAIERLEIPLLGDHGTLHVTASFGVAALPESALDREELIAAADSALYQAKSSGKNRTVQAQ